MTLSAGTRLGPYEVGAPLGAGGMGEVYRARDTRLGRDVAVKVLPPQFASDADRLRRFEQEARAAGALSHPNVLAVHDIGQHDGVPYVVSELLEGETLRHRLGGTPMAARRAVDYGAQMAAGLAAAHDRGIVHRDLKPENVFVTKDGRVKLLDFGLAKLAGGSEAAAAGLTGAPTLTVDTEPGAVLGTVGYMAPEQVRGRSVDHRADIFSFGAILYEMLSGRRAFRGDSAVETMNAILKEDPPEVSTLQPQVPPALDRIVRHCLEKSPEERFQSARDLAFDLTALSETSGAGSGVAVSPVSRRSGIRRGGLALVGLGLLGAAALGYLAGTGGAGEAQLPSFRTLTFRRGWVLGARFIPGGDGVVYSAAWEGAPAAVFTARAAHAESQPLDFGDADVLAISPTGEVALLLERRFTAGWMSEGTLARVPLTGSGLRRLSERVQDADWTPEGELVAARYEGIRSRLEWPLGRVLIEASGWFSHPRVSPRGDRVAVLEHPSIGDDSGDLVLVDRDGERTVLVDAWGSIQGLAWHPDGDALWVSGMRDSAPITALITTRGEERLALRTPGNCLVQDAAPGRLLLNVGSARREILVAREGEPHERNLSWHDWSFPLALSGDGESLLFGEQARAGGGTGQIYLRRLDGSPAVHLGPGIGCDLSRDGKWVLAGCETDPVGLRLLPTGVGTPRPLDTSWLASRAWGALSADGRQVLLTGRDSAGTQRTYLIDVESGAHRPLGPEGYALGRARRPVSPDGRSVLLARDNDVIAQPLAGGDPTRLPGFQPAEQLLGWSADGLRLYSLLRENSGVRVWRVDTATGARELMREIHPSDPTGVNFVGPAFVGPDDRTLVYSVRRTLYDLYQVEGLP